VDPKRVTVPDEVPATPASRRWAAPSIYVAAAALVLFTPLKWPCPILTVFGVPCPACGMTRATRSALHGDFAHATAMHPLWWLVVPFVGAAFTIEMVGYLRTGRWGASARVPRSGAILVAVCAIVFAVWIARFFGAFGGPVPTG
jgi:hypothetical protein